MKTSILIAQLPQLQSFFLDFAEYLRNTASLAFFICMLGKWFYCFSNFNVFDLLLLETFKKYIPVCIFDNSI